MFSFAVGARTGLLFSILFFFNEYLLKYLSSVEPHILKTKYSGNQFSEI